MLITDFDSEYSASSMMTSYKCGVIGVKFFEKWAWENILTWIQFGQWITLSILVIKSFTSRNLFHDFPQHHLTSNDIQKHYPTSRKIVRHHEFLLIREVSYDLIWTNQNAKKQDGKCCHLHTFEYGCATFVSLPSNGNGDRASKFWRFGF